MIRGLSLHLLEYPVIFPRGDNKFFSTHMSLFFIIFIASLAESLVSLVGGVLTIFNEKAVRRVAHFVVSFAVGALLGVSLLELIPESISAGSVGETMIFVLVGIIFFFVLEKFLFWYHCHGGVCPVHTYTYLILWGDFLHNFVDGMMIALTFLVDIRLGIIATGAVLFHEIPQEIGDMAILLHGGFSKKKAIFYNFFISLSTILGAVLTYALGGLFESALPFAIAIVAGNFLYIAASDLMPELHESTKFSHSVLQIVLIVAGAFLIMVPDFLFG